MSKSNGSDITFIFGTAFAMILSWTTFHSFWWTLLHGIFGWFYVIYYFLIANYDATIVTSLLH